MTKEDIEKLPLVQLRQACRELLSERDALGKAIGDAAIAAGIIDGTQPLTGPQLIQLCEDLVKISSPPLSPVATCVIHFYRLAVTCAAHIPVCQGCWDRYEKEVLLASRPFWKQLQGAYEKKLG